MNALMIPMIMIGVMLLFGAIFWITMNTISSRKLKNKAKAEAAGIIEGSKAKEENAYKHNPTTAIKKEDIFKFMEFDKIEDNMIIQNGGTKFTAILKCKGINYALMSEMEQLAVEEGFITFLNTLKTGIQLYVQAQTIDLKESIRKYKEHLQGLDVEYDDKNTEYNILMNSLESTDKEIADVEKAKNSIANVVDYGNDIIKYVERLSANKNMLQRSFYILVSYYSSEISIGTGLKKSETEEMCYNELYTRVQNIMSGLLTCSISSQVLDSSDIAELLYSAYNRDDKNYINVKQALESGFHRLYSTSVDAIQKKNTILVEGMRKEAEYKAISALAKAVEEGSYVSPEMAEDIYDQETSRQAIELVKNERIDDETKLKAKSIIVDEYKKEKQIRIKKIKEEISEAQKILEKKPAVEEAIEIEKQPLEEIGPITSADLQEPDKENIAEGILNDDLISDVVTEDKNSEDSEV